MSKFLNGNNRQVSIWPCYIEMILFVSSETIQMTSTGWLRGMITLLQ